MGVIAGDAAIETIVMVITTSILAVRHAFEGKDTAREESADGAVLCLGDGGAWRGDGARAPGARRS